MIAHHLLTGGRCRGVRACLLEVAGQRLLRYDRENFYMDSPIHPFMP